MPSRFAKLSENSRGLLLSRCSVEASRQELPNYDNSPHTVVSIDKMVLGESYLHNILRAPPASVAEIPPNPLHPFQKSLTFYIRKRFIPHHTPLVFGYAFAIFCFAGIDGAMKNATVKKFEASIEAGKAPCECQHRETVAQQLPPFRSARFFCCSCCTIVYALHFVVAILLAASGSAASCSGRSVRTLLPEECAVHPLTLIFCCCPAVGHHH